MQKVKIELAEDRRALATAEACMLDTADFSNPSATSQAV